jgi:glutamate synthase (NADPH/NADH)
MAKLGFRTINEMVGHAECLRVREDLRSNKTQNIDLSLILTPAHKLRPGVATFNVRKQDHRLYVRLDNKLISEAELTLDKGLPSRIECDIVNTDRAMGTSLSYQISKRYGEDGLPMDTVHVNIKGSAGQSFGAFCAPGVTLELEGDANDYVGKGLSGGRLIIYPPRASVFKAEENVLIGNVCLYGATSGTCFFRGVAAERFAVRNSGATAVVEGVGDHGCEYMTGGRVLILGSTGRNFAAGMSGGIAYILDIQQDFLSRLNPEMVEASGIDDPAEIAFVRGLIEDHHHYTGSELAARILLDFNRALPRFVKVLPVDYKRVLEEEAAKAAEAKRAEYQLPLLPGNPVRELHEKNLKEKHEKKSDLQDIEETVGDAAVEKKRSLVLDKTKGFMKYQRRSEKYRSAKTRTRDWAELSKRLDEDELKYQAARCMDCGVPFCQSDSGCPISNIIPKWNELIFQCLSPDTLVRTTSGIKATRDINVGEKLLDHNDMPVLCTGVGDIKTSSTMKTIKYKEWNSKVDVSFDCTSDHIMSMKAYGVSPTIKLGCVVVWYTRCDRTELIEESKTLKWDELMHDLYHGLSMGLGRRPTDAETQSHIDLLVDEWLAAPDDSDGDLFHVYQDFKDTAPAEELAGKFLILLCAYKLLTNMY